MMNTSVAHQEITQKELDELMSRVEHAIENELSLSVDDLKLLLLAIHTLSTLQQNLEDKSTTLHKLRKLLGMVKQSEKRTGGKPSSSHSKGKGKGSSKNSGKKRPPKVKHHSLKTLQKGDLCPECERGKLYKFDPARLLRVNGHAPFEATQHISERVRCNACQQLFTATLPEEVLADGAPDQHYGYSARALMALHKFYSGLPYHHQGNFSGMMGVTICASTIFDQCEHLANMVMPVFYALKRLSANAKLFLLDDTMNRILNQQPEERANRNGKGTRVRTGVYSSGVVAYTNENQEIALFETSLGHAGEFIDTLLAKRDTSLPPPILMSDALSSNTPTVMDVHQAYCNAHCRREFFDLQTRHPERVNWLLDTYAKIWENETHVKEQQYDAQARLDYHIEHSLPIMEKLKRWAEDQQTSPTFEEHSAFGKAINYLVRHYERLTLFCRLPGVPLDNNRMEETLKLVIRNRKTSHFFKTENGAGVSNVLTSMIATAMRAEVNLFDYLLALQRYHETIQQDPSAWFPWNYLDTLDMIHQDLAQAA